MKKFKLKAEFHDIVEVAAIDTGDIIIHFVINFKSHIDEVRLSKAARLGLYAEPILSCDFKEGFFRAYWQYRDPSAIEQGEIFKVIKTNNIGNEIHK